MEFTYRSIATAPAAVKLEKLARTPYDLTRKESLTEGDRLQRYICSGNNFRLLYAMQRVDDEVLSALQQLADECELVSQFQAMRSGAVMNRIDGFESEERQVLHCSCRDIFTDSPKEADASDLGANELAKLKDFLDKLDRGEIVNADGEPFTTMLHIGIGGSDLGPRSVYEALQRFGKKGRSVHFISNVDPDDGARVLEQVDLKRALVNIVSKSGTTLETLTNEKFVISKLVEQGLDPAIHCLAVTGKGSPMDDPSKYRQSFYMFDFIGGRYSTTSMVGAVMLGFFMGYDNLINFLKGANGADELAENPSVTENLPLLLALIGVWNHNFLKCHSLAILPYSQALHRFPAHLQQCDMESNGKSISRSGERLRHKTGPVIWGEPGTNGQHAFYQLLHQGTEIVPVEFIGFLKSQYGDDIEVKGTSSQEKLLANLLAQSIAFAQGKTQENPNRNFTGNRPSSMLLADRLDPETMGELLAIYEAKIAFQGFIWNINSFDQEGVQLGKVLATRLLDLMQNPTGSPESFESALLKLVRTGG